MLSEEARQARNAYNREYARETREARRISEERHWEKVAKENGVNFQEKKACRKCGYFSFYAKEQAYKFCPFCGELLVETSAEEIEKIRNKKKAERAAKRFLERFENEFGSEGIDFLNCSIGGKKISDFMEDDVDA